MKFKSFLIVLFVQFSFLQIMSQTPKPKLSVKQSKNLVFLDSETNKKSSVMFTSIFANDGATRGKTTWTFSGTEKKDWKYIEGYNANSENVEVEFLKVGNYSLELVVEYSYNTGEEDDEEDEVDYEQENIVTAANYLDQLQQIYADSSFLKLVKKASDYLVKTEYANDPTPNIFLAKGYYGIYRNKLPDPIVSDPWEETINSIASAIELDLNGIFNQKVHKRWLNKFQNDFLNNYLFYNLEEEDGYYNIYNGKDQEKKSELLELLLEGVENYATITTDQISIQFLEAPIRAASKDVRTANSIWKNGIKRLKNMTKADFDNLTYSDQKALKYGAMLSAVTLTNLRKSNTEACEILSSLKDFYPYDRGFLAFLKTRYNNCKEE